MEILSACHNPLLYDSCEIAKMPKNTRHVASRLFKVIDFVTNRKDICDFLLLVTSVVSLTVSEQSRGLLVKQSPLGPNSVSFNALARSDP